ncbi:ATP-dependent Clp protease ATP-binding subunit ClpC, partial [Candidatus Hakubella thermalkaliphila]
DPTMGARPLRRAIQRRIEDPLSEEILAGNIKDGQKITTELREDRVLFTAVDENKVRAKVKSAPR